jgi:hypothetical protein
MNGRPMAHCDDSFEDNASNKLAEYRSALSTPDTSSVAKCSRLTTLGQCAHRGAILVRVPGGWSATLTLGLLQGCPLVGRDRQGRKEGHIAASTPISLGI